MLKVTGDIYLMGDFHGLDRAFFANLERFGIKNSTIICVGDIGAGYPNYKENKLNDIGRRLALTGNKMIAIRGNHDNPAFFHNNLFGPNGEVNLLEDYTYLDVNGETWLMVGGATSVDRITSIPGISYWEDEVFVLKEELVKPCDILVTHSGPSWIGPTRRNGIVTYYVEKEGEHLWNELCAERELLNKLYSLAKPKKAFLGHFHESTGANHDGCRARILNELELLQYAR